MYVIIDFFVKFIQMTSEIGLYLLEFLNSYPEVLGVRLLDYTYAELMFGLGLPILFGLVAVKFIVGIVK